MRKSRKGNLHLFSQLNVVCQTFRSRRRIMDERNGVVFRSFFTNRGLNLARFFLFALPHAVNRVIRRDAIDPGSKIRPCLKLPKLLIRAQERLLDHFFGVGPAPRHSVSQPENIVAMPLDENAKSIPVAAERAFHGDGVAVSDGLGVLDARH